MSYEGREISICEKGHLIYSGCDYSFDGPEPCHCGAQIVWFRMVDDTNCEAYGDFPIGVFKIKTSEVTNTCPTCQHTTLIEDATYEIPTCTNCGSQEIRSGLHQPHYGGTPFVGNIKCEACGTVLFSSQS